MTTATEKRYIEKMGRRKTSSARVRITPATKMSVVINNKPVEEYFPTVDMQTVVNEPFAISATTQKFTITVVAKGGGIHSQAEAVRHGIAQALVEFDADNKTTIKKAKLLTRDSRAKERRKFGLKKARKSPQWSKR
ncbi:MAG: 30S ribosomal protein S9 [Candidatus Vogelbacteria bacterium RIFOXYD2_FULL_44_9]|uniref:Small ribosomal subunit protein uS9 n=1 Tax=Candidatus Vogelbacteria bacterium RIFOXYD2_FULL_44_9 TaxID=1802441 RepID=A0A1G2QQ35_9BACT|nr:MAG: 30S ribosomal protein S9 [Candidatus Vogelbacteria bacterium RIFOXYD2_FULL_44_9]